MRANYGKPLRAWLSKKPIEEIIDFGDLPVFKKATTYPPCILRVSKGAPKQRFKVVQVATLDFSDLSQYVKENGHSINQDSLDDNGWSLVDQNTRLLLDKLMKSGVPLGEYVEKKIYYGIKTGLNEAFVIGETTKDRLIAEDPKNAEVIKPFLAGREIKRYIDLKPQQYLILFEKGWTNKNSGNIKNKWIWLKEKYPSIANHLEPFTKDGESRYDKGDYWWELRSCDYYREFEEEKILYAEIATTGQFTLDNNGLYSDTTSYIMGSNSLYLLGILNSRLWTFMFSNVSSIIRGGDFSDGNVNTWKISLSIQLIPPIPKIWPSIIKWYNLSNKCLN